LRVLLSHEFRELQIDLPQLPSDVLQCCRYSILGRDVESRCPTDVGRNERFSNGPLPTFSTIAHLILLPPSCPARCGSGSHPAVRWHSMYQGSKSCSSSISASRSSAVDSSGFMRTTPRVCGVQHRSLRRATSFRGDGANHTRDARFRDLHDLLLRHKV